VFLSPLTGAAANWGNDLKNILNFSNEKLYNSKFEFDFQDDRCNPQGAVTVAKLFTNIKKYKYVTGFVCSGTILAAAQDYEKTKTLTFVLGGSAPAISSSGDYIFRTWPSDASAARLLYGHLLKKHKKVGILSEETDYARALQQAIEDLNTDNKIQIRSEGFLSSENDFRSTLLKLTSSGIEGLFLNTQTEQSLNTLVKKIHELKITLPLYSVYMADARAFLDQAKDLAEGIIVVDAPQSETLLNEQGKKFYENYVKTHGAIQTVNLLFISTLNALHSLNAALLSNQEPKDYLYKTEFNGISGNWRFDKNGDIEGLGFVINIIKDNKPQLLGQN
jgi:branched-chain amino acid transport system substrate-binding protein